jgi:asparagine synthase (glutamine-hydrolysing)
MCGISGFMGPVDSRDRALQTLGAMTDAIVHRGPDDFGYWIDEAAGIGLGNRRLAVVDLSPAGHQPMESADGRYVMTYNGEVYNFTELRAELETKGHSFRGHSDTEVMLEAFSEWGVDDAVGRFNGMFALALWDRSDRVLHLARDRMGKKPLYYGWFGRTLLFGSELKVLRQHPEFKGDIDRGALAAYLRHSYVPSPYSIYEGVKKLPPGSLLTIRPSGELEVEPRPFWSLSDAFASSPSFAGDDEEAVTHLDELLREAVRIRMIADVPLGAFLSGGIDSSTIVALMQAQSSIPVQTFTIGFHEPSYNEAEYAKKVAAHLGTNHRELYVSPEEAMAVIPRLAEIYDEPFSDSSQIPTFLISELARRHVTVSLSGDGGDELFGGYERYVQGARAWRTIGWTPRGLRRGLGRLLHLPSPRTWDRVLSRARFSRPGHKVHRLGEVLGVDGPERLYHGLVSHWPQPAVVVRGAIELPTPLTDPGRWPARGDFIQRASYMDALTYLPDDILVKVDRASMAVSLEARAPLLDPNIVAFAWSLPTSLKVRNGKGKWLLRSLLHRYVPRELVERPKMGFGVPIDSWLRGPLRQWAEDLLAPSRLEREGFLHPEPIQRKWREHLAGTREWHYHLWDVLMFQAWLEGAKR